jgi:hypothetical protein
VGRFIQADTIVPSPGNPQHFNRYSYVLNNPLKYSDPSGHEEWLGLGGCDGDCRNDIPDDLPLPTIETWSWDQLSEEYQHLAYEAYQNYRANPEYYESLFWNDPSNPELAKLQIWAEYAENKSLHLFMRLDPYAYEEQKIEQAQQLLASGEIDAEEYVRMIAPSMLALGLMNFNESSCPPVNQMNKQIRTGKAPGGIKRVDMGDPNLYELPHVHFDDGAALNVNGTWKHGFTDLTGKQKKWLQQHGWRLP